MEFVIFILTSVVPAIQFELFAGLHIDVFRYRCITWRQVGGECGNGYERCSKNCREHDARKAHYK